MTEDEKTFRIYEMFSQRVGNFDRLLAERANIYLVFSSILLGTLVLLANSSSSVLNSPLILILPITGVILSVFSWSAVNASITELQFWLARCRIIELSDDCFHSLRERELTVYAGLDDWRRGEGKSFPDRHKRPIWMPRRPSGQPKIGDFQLLHAWNMYRAFPIIFLVVWLVSLGWILFKLIT